MIEQIQDLYSKVKGKTKFIKFAAQEVGNSPLTLRNHWFSAFWSIPAEHQQEVVDLLNKWLEKQKVTA